MICRLHLSERSKRAHVERSKKESHDDNVRTYQCRHISDILPRPHIKSIIITVVTHHHPPQEGSGCWEISSAGSRGWSFLRGHPFRPW